MKLFIVQQLKFSVIERLKFRIFGNVVRLVAIHGYECYSTIEDNIRQLAVIETELLHWTRGIIRCDQIRNDDIWGRYGIAAIA